jgi:hypothetical protein
VILGSQILTGVWPGRQRDKRTLLICLIVVAVNCVLGRPLRVNSTDTPFNAPIWMSIWSIPLLATTVAIGRTHRRKSLACQTTLAATASQPGFPPQPHSRTGLPETISTASLLS